MFLPVLVVALLSQTPVDRSPIGVVISSKRSGADQISKKYVDQLQLMLRKEGIGTLTVTKLTAALKNTGLDDPRTCDGASACLAKIAVVLGPHAVVIGIDVGKIQKNLAVHLSAMAADTSEPLAVSEFIAKEDKWLDQSNSPLTTFVSELKSRLATSTTSVVVDKPPEKQDVKSDVPKKDPALTPDHPKDPPLVIKDEPVPEKAGKGPVPWVLGGVGVAGIATGVAFAVLWNKDDTYRRSTLTTETLPSGMPGATKSSLSLTEYQQLDRQVGTEGATAAIAGGVGVILSGIATYLFLKE